MGRPMLAVCKHGHDLTLEDSCSWDADHTRRWCRLCVEAKTAVQNERRKQERCYRWYLAAVAARAAAEAPHPVTPGAAASDRDGPVTSTPEPTEKEPAMTTTDPLDLHTLPRRAAALIESRGWTQHTERDDAGHLCLTGALRYCDQQPGDGYLVREVYAHWDLTPRWNDSAGRTAGEVIGVLRRDITDTDLAETFGPQWEQIVALVRRAAVLTADGCERLDAARDAAWDAARSASTAAAWDAARSAATAAARAAARSAAKDAAAWAAARDAAWAATRDAAWDAARGLVVRDLIGTDGFTQQHYDTLTLPWRTAIGPVHPDDAAPVTA